MSTDSVSRTSVPTCADVIDRINLRADLPLRHRQDLTSAVRGFCRIEGHPPAEIEADPAKLRTRLRQMSAATTRLSPGGFRNLKSLVTKSMIVAEITSVPRRSRVPLPPEWQQFLDGIPHRGYRYRLSHFARYCAERGRLPVDVDDEIMSEYGHDLVSKSLLDRPKQAHRTACLAFNKGVEASSGAQMRNLRIPSNRRAYALPLSALPASFQHDLEDYLAHLRGDDLLGEMASRPASPDTIQGRRKQVLALASALVEAGHDPLSIRSLADLVDPRAAKAALTVLWQRLGRRKTGYLHNLALLLVNLARHWVEVSPKDLKAIQLLRRNLDPGKSGMTEANRRKLLQFDDGANVAALLELPDLLISEAVRRDRGGVAEAVLAQTAAAIAIVLAAPIRLNTLVQLDLDRHVLRSRPGRNGVVHLAIPAGLVKNRVPLELVLPPRAIRILDIYSERFRPRLLAQAGSWLFPGRHGPKDRGGMSRQISETIKKFTGIRMHTHLFRHLAGFLILRHNPGEFETVRLLLGHRSLQTTVTFYRGLEQSAAFRRYDELISSYESKEHEDDED